MEKHAGLKYQVHRWGFVVGVALIVVARAAVVFVGAGGHIAG